MVQRKLHSDRGYRIPENIELRTELRKPRCCRGLAEDG